jgi:hypothetical protein
LILLRKFKITPFSTFLDSLDKNSFINALTDSFEILVFLIVLLKNGCWVFSVALKNIDQKVAFSLKNMKIMKTLKTRLNL